MNEHDLIQPMLACGPLLIAQLVIGAASAATAYSSQKNQAKATEQHQRTVGKLQLEQSVLNQSDLIQRNAETEEATVRESLEIQRKSSLARASATTSALEGGAGGAVLEALQGEYMQREAELMFASTQQRDMASNRLDRDLERMRKQSQGQFASTFRPINQPSAAAHALDFASSATSAYSDFKVREATK